MNLTEKDYVNSVPKCIQYADLVDKGDFRNPFYLYPSNDGKDIVSSVYYIIGGCWDLKITSYDPDTGILIGSPRLYLNSEPMKFKAIPIKEGIKHRYIGAMAGEDASNLKELEILRNR